MFQSAVLFCGHCLSFDAKTVSHSVRTAAFSNVKGYKIVGSSFTLLQVSLKLGLAVEVSISTSYSVGPGLKCRS